MCVYLRTKFQVSGIILTSLRGVQGEGGIIIPIPPTSKRTLKRPTQIRVISFLGRSMAVKLGKLMTYGVKPYVPPEELWHQTLQSADIW